MLGLNDDCICYIFDRLKVRDQVMLTDVCERFRNIIVSIQWRSSFRRFITNGDDAIDTLSMREYMSLFQLILPKIEHLVIMALTHTSKDTWRPKPAFYLRFEFPALTILEYHIDVCDLNMKLLADHCPLLEKLYLNSRIFLRYDTIVKMRHLRILNAPSSFISAYNLQLLLTLPLTELVFKLLLMFDDPPALAQALKGASDLQIMRMHLCSHTLPIIKSLAALASTADRRYPLTLQIASDKGFRYNFFLDCFILPSTSPILVQHNMLEFRFFRQPNKKIASSQSTEK